MNLNSLLPFVQQNIFLVVIAVTSGSFLLWTFIERKNGMDLTPAQATLKINREDAVVLDVRDTSEWAKGRIPNARHITLGQLEDRVSELEKFKDRPIIVYCASGNRSTTACGKLKKAGFAQVFNLAGGLPAWSDASLPVTTK